MCRLRGTKFTLLIAKSDDGVDAHGAAGRNEARGESHCDEKRDDGQEDERVRRAYAVNQSREKASHGKSGNDTEDHACQNEFQTFTQNQPENIARVGAERHANTDLARALRDSEGNDSVDAHAGQDQCESREQPQEKHHETAECERVGEHLLHGACRAGRNSWVNGGDGIADGTAEAERIDIGADKNNSREPALEKCRRAVGGLGCGNESGGSAGWSTWDFTSPTTPTISLDVLPRKTCSPMGLRWESVCERKPG